LLQEGALGEQGCKIKFIVVGDARVQPISQALHPVACQTNKTVEHALNAMYLSRQPNAVSKGFSSNEYFTAKTARGDWRMPTINGYISMRPPPLACEDGIFVIVRSFEFNVCKLAIATVCKLLSRDCTIFKATAFTARFTGVQLVDYELVRTKVACHSDIAIAA
jgi:hypothetical protein